MIAYVLKGRGAQKNKKLSLNTIGHHYSNQYLKNKKFPTSECVKSIAYKLATVFVIPISQSVNMDGGKQFAGGQGTSLDNTKQSEEEYDKESKSQQIY